MFEYGATGEPQVLLRGQVTPSDGELLLEALDATGNAIGDTRWQEGKDNGHDAVKLLQWIETRPEAGQLAAVGHRIVHGGGRFVAPVIATARVLEELEALTPLAPLHQPLGLAPLKAIAHEQPQLRHVCCFDTAFHNDLSPPASRYGIPRKWEARGIRRYGFHGLSYQSISDQLRQSWPQLATDRVVVAHLGSGASLCAMVDGRSIDTTMGFSTLDGLLMGTRPGSVDPGIVLHLQRSGLSLDEVEHLLYHECGLLGVSGISADVRDLLVSDAPSAREAVELFVFRIARETAALVASLGGIDGFVFTGGIGQHSAAIRELVMERLQWLGIQIDPAANATGRPLISHENSRATVLALPTDEEKVIATQCRAALQTGY